MWATSDGPKIEDFGISESDLARLPRLLVASHRSGLLVGVYLVAASALFWLLLDVGGSWPAALFFTVIILAAVSVLLLPAVFFAVCAGEQAEERWMCRRFPALRACLAYQKAVADHSRRNALSQLGSAAHEDWFGISQPTALTITGETLNRMPLDGVTEVDREISGFDFLIESDGWRLILRCEPGSDPTTAAIGRELAATLGDFDADAAFVITAVGPTTAFGDYVANKPIYAVGIGELAEAIPNSEFRIPNSAGGP